MSFNLFKTLTPSPGSDTRRCTRVGPDASHSCFHATATNVCTTDARLGGVGLVPAHDARPNQNPDYRGDNI